LRIAGVGRVTVSLRKSMISVAGVVLDIIRILVGRYQCVHAMITEITGWVIATNGETLKTNSSITFTHDTVGPP